MNPPLEHIRLNKKARAQLTRLRRSTGISQWNTLTRWAFCNSLRDPTIPPAVEGDSSTGVEIAWRVFSGDLNDVFAALFRVWLKRSESSAVDPAELVKRHIQRGLSLMDALSAEGISDLIQTVSEENF